MRLTEDAEQAGSATTGHGQGVAHDDDGHTHQVDCIHILETLTTESCMFISTNFIRGLLVFGVTKMCDGQR